MTRWLVLFVLMIASSARADEVAGVVVDDAGAGLPHEAVRVVGEKVVINARTDDLGQFRVTGLPGGSYRVEVERGTVRPPTPPRPPIVITRNEIRCCICAMDRGRRFEAALRRAALDPAKPRLIDTRSTTQGMVIRDPGRR